MRDITIKTVGGADIATASDGSFNITIPIKISRRGRRKTITLPEGTALKPRNWDTEPTPIQLALARGYKWLGMIESGEPENIAEVAEKEGVDRSYVSRMVNLTTLAPDIVAAILDETLPDHVTLFDLASGTPLLWDEQRKLAGC